MMTRVFKFLNRESAGINEAALLLGLFTFVSQILGLVRDRLLATSLGAGRELDIYYAAFKIPDLLYNSVATLAALTVLLPYLSEKYGTGDETGHTNARNFLNQTFTILLIFLTITSLILFISMPWLAHVVAPGFDGPTRETLVWLSRLMLLQPIIIGVSNMLSSVSQMFKKFLITALAPLVYNIGIIIGITVLYPWYGIAGLAYGVVLGAILHLLIQLPVLMYHRMMPRLVSRVSWNEMKSLIKVSIPRTLGLSISSLTAFILTAMASLLGTGSIGVFNLTNNILNVPMGIIGISYSVASFPILIRLIQTNDRNTFSQYIARATQKILFFSIPVTILFIMLRFQIVRVILGERTFVNFDMTIATTCLALFMIGLVAQSLVHLLVRAYYAAGKTKQPLIMNFLGEIITVVLAVVLIYIARNVGSDVIRAHEIYALPLAFSIGNIINYITLRWVFVRDFPEIRNHRHDMNISPIIIASIGLMIGVWGGLWAATAWFPGLELVPALLQGIIGGLAGSVISVIILVKMKNQDILDVWHMIRRKVGTS